MNAEQLLEELKTEREKYTRSDKAKMESLCQSLVDLGVYPAVSKINLSALKMVEGWGVHWHKWSGPTHCRHCNSDLRDHECGPPFKRELGVTVNDRTSHFLCPDCGKTIMFR